MGKQLSTGHKSARLVEPLSPLLLANDLNDSGLMMDNSLSSIGLNDSVTSGIQRKIINMAKIKRLPPTFAQKMLDYEMEIESGQFNGETVNELFELYGDAVEFYNIKNDKRFMYYETKIQNMLVKPEIMMAMAAGKSKAKPTKE